MAQYIDKNALMAEIERRIRELEPFRTEDNLRAHGAITGYYQVLSFIGTLEVKEVDLNKEIEKCLKKHNMLAVGKKDFTDIAKHFFELGLSVNNPITAADRGTAEEIIINLKRVEQDYRIDLTKEMEWVRNQVKKGK